MKVDPIEQLLVEADAHSQMELVNAHHLAQRVLKAQRRRRAAGWSGVALVPIIALLVWALVPQQRAINTPDTLAALRSRIDFQEATIARLVRSEQRGTRLVRLTIDDDPSERAAAQVVYQADRLARQSGLEESALRAYHEVIDTFPNTVSAQRARERAVEMRKAS